MLILWSESDVAKVIVGRGRGLCAKLAILLSVTKIIFCCINFLLINPNTLVTHGLILMFLYRNVVSGTVSSLFC